MNDTDFDVVIIGGGPAGSTAGINLARQGLKTAIFERKSFPRETLCGEFLSAEVISHLIELHLFEKFLSLGPNKISTFRLVTSNNKIFDSTLPFEGYSIKRSVFDNFLLNAAAESGVRIFQPAEVAEIKYHKNFCMKFLSGNQLLDISAKFVIGAYGKSNILDKKLNRPFAGNQSVYYGIKFHLKKELLAEFSDSAIYIFSGYNIYCGINTVGDNEVTVCFLGRKESDSNSPRVQLNNLIKENKNFASLFKNERSIDLSKQKIYGTGNIYFGKKNVIPSGIIMIGDAAGLIAPLAGDGIGMAIESAKMASEIIADSIYKNANRIEIYNTYRVSWKKHFTKRLFIAGRIQNIIMSGLFNKIHPLIVRFSTPYLISATRNM
jgi:flavin-dependent dehydrogenase